jgi:hypothetical protein
MSNINDFIIENETLIKYNGSDAEVVIPAGVKVIGKSAFEKNNTITKVALSNGVIQLD